MHKTHDGVQSFDLPVELGDGVAGGVHFHKQSLTILVFCPESLVLERFRAERLEGWRRAWVCQQSEEDGASVARGSNRKKSTKPQVGPQNGIGTNTAAAVDNSATVIVSAFLPQADTFSCCSRPDEDEKRKHGEGCDSLVRMQGSIANPCQSVKVGTAVVSNYRHL